MEEYGVDIVTITDEDGVSYEMEILSRFEFEGSEYVALTPADADDEEAELEVNILKITVENGEELLEAISDEDELEKVYEAMMDMLFEEEEEE